MPRDAANDPSDEGARDGEPARRGIRPYILALAPLAIFVLAMGAFYSVYDAYRPVGENILPGGAFERPADDGAWNGFGGAATWAPDIGIEGSGGVRLPADGEARGRIVHVLEDVREFEFVRFRGFMRTEDVGKGNRDWKVARFVVFFKDAAGKAHWGHPHVVMTLTGTHPWRAYERTFRVPPYARTGYVLAQNAGGAGVAYADEMSLVPMRRVGYDALVRAGFALAFLVVFVHGIARLRLWRRRLGVPLVALLLFTVVAVVAPAESFTVVGTQADALVEAVRELAGRFAADEEPEPWLEAPLALPRPAAEDGAPDAEAAPDVPAAPSPDERAKPRPKPKPEPAGDSGGFDLDLASGLNEMKKIGHAIVFGLLGLVAAFSFGWGARRWIVTTAIVLGALTVFGAATELLQLLVEKRQSSFYDLGIDVLGAIVGAALGLALLALRAGVARVFPRRRGG